MGSGAFLVAACRYLAAAYEDALIAEGTVSRARHHAGGSRRLPPRGRAAMHLRRGPESDGRPARAAVAVAVHAGGRSAAHFLDHHLRAGNSLAGARADRRRPPAAGPGRRRPSSPLPLFETDDLADRARVDGRAAADWRAQPDDSAAIVRRKERVIEELAGAAAPLAAWRAVADAWCAAWFWPADVERVTPRAWPAFSGALRGAASGLPERAGARSGARPRRRRARASGSSTGSSSSPRCSSTSAASRAATPGFDAVIGNPPWAAARELTAVQPRVGLLRAAGPRAREPVPAVRRADAAARRARRPRRHADAVGAAGRSRLRAAAPAPVRALHGGRGHRLRQPRRAVSDSPRRPLLARDGVHRRHRRRTCRRAPACDRRRCWTTSRTKGPCPDGVRVPLTLVRRFSGPASRCRSSPHARDREILARILASAPHARQRRGLAGAVRPRAECDRRPRTLRTGRPAGARRKAARRVRRPRRRTRGSSSIRRRRRRLLGDRARFDRPRLGYREVAASTNRMTLIAAIIPAGAVTTHTIFCMREPRDEPLHWFLCGVFNSFVANYLVRLRGGTHVPAAVIHQLPVPVPPRDSRRFAQIVRLSRAAAADPRRRGVRAELQARVTHAYGLDERRFRSRARHVPARAGRRARRGARMRFGA